LDKQGTFDEKADAVENRLLELAARLRLGRRRQIIRTSTNSGARPEFAAKSNELPSARINAGASLLGFPKAGCSTLVAASSGVRLRLGSANRGANRLTKSDSTDSLESPDSAD
jgi:hypothetical protein